MFTLSHNPCIWRQILESLRDSLAISFVCCPKLNLCDEKKKIEVGQAKGVLRPIHQSTTKHFKVFPRAAAERAA